MSDFEEACWMWYLDRVTPATIKAGLVGRFWPAVEGPVADIFLKAFNRIDTMFDRIKAEQKQDRMKK